MNKYDITKKPDIFSGPQYTFSLQLQGSAVDIILFTNPTAGFYASAHTHSGHEFHYICEGSSTLRIGSHSYPMSGGNCYMVAGGTFHHVTMVSKEIRRISLLIIPRNNAIVPEKLPPFTGFTPNGHMNQLLSLLLSALSERQLADFENYVSSCVTMLLIELLGQLSPESPISSEDSASIPARSLEGTKQEILSYMANNLATASLEDLAVLLHISPRQTARFLQKTLGDTFSGLLRKHRIEYAKSLMLSGTLSLEEIAFLSGYQSYKGFHSAFCKYTGINPKAYKENHS